MKPPVQFRVDSDGFATTHNQVNTLVEIIGQLEAVCRDKDEDDSNDSDKSWKKKMPAALDGESRMSIDTAIMKAADRLSSILDDTERWSAQPKGYGKSIRKLIDSQIEVQAEIGFNESLKRRPSSALRPFVKQLPDGRYVVYLTGPDGRAALAGVGSTPAEAAEDFDRTYLNGSPTINDPKPQDRTDQRPAQEEPGADQQPAP